ncbi:MAG: hypothetical protein JW741_15145 [Sedimentisphaerales bacterium]|nr:hypothetical protein [Sedimentisphaerales bacterium]
MYIGGKKQALLMVCLVGVVAGPASVTQAYPPDPDNAALLYYQGFLSVPDFNEVARTLISDVARGKVAPNDAVRKHIEDCSGAIGMAEAAAEVPECNWGFRFSQGFEALMPHLSQARFLTFILVADARVRAADGDYRGALERCLVIRTFSRHMGDDTLISYLVSLALRTLGYNCMQDVMGQVDDAELLRWLQSELATDASKGLSPVRPLKYEMEIVLEVMQMKNLDRLARVLADTNEAKMQEIVKKADEEILARARQAYAERATAAMKAYDMPLPYEQVHPRLKRWVSDFDPNDPVMAAVSAFMPAMTRIYTLDTKAKAHANAVKAGLEICLLRAKSGKLPGALPEGLPKDAFSGEDFEYKRTDDGFVLRCRKPDLDKNETYEYAFTVK